MEYGRTGTIAMFSPLPDCVSKATMYSGSGVRRPKTEGLGVFSETIKRINAKFCGKVPIDHISRPFFRFSKF